MRRLLRIASQSTCLILTIALVIPFFEAPSVRAIASTPTYVLGVSNPMDPLIVDLQSLTSSITILPGISSLTLVGGGSILYVDGQWMQTATSLDPTVLSLIIGKVLGGVPTIVVRGNPSIIGDSISGLVKTRAPDLPLISQGIQIVGTLADGTRQANVLQVIAGFDYAVQAEFTWAQQLFFQTIPTTPAQSPATATASSANRKPSQTITPADTSGGPSFIFTGVFRTDTGDFFAPMGRVSYTFTLWVLQNSGSSAYKWYNFFFNETLQPGILVYNSDWRTLEETDHVSVNNRTSNLFVDHGPTPFSTVGPSTITYAVGTQANVLGAVVTANQTRSYFLKNTNVTDISQDPFNIGWDHLFNARTSAGKLVYSIIPGWTDRVTTDGRIDFEGTFTSIFGRFSGSNIVQTSPATLRLSVGGG